MAGNRTPFLAIFVLYFFQVISSKPFLAIVVHFFDLDYRECLVWHEMLMRHC